MSDPPAWLEPSRLELLADDAGMSPGELREWLRSEIAKREAKANDVAKPPALTAG
jgi:hypothetical protein